MSHNFFSFKDNFLSSVLKDVLEGYSKVAVSKLKITQLAYKFYILVQVAVPVIDTFES